MQKTSENQYISVITRLSNFAERMPHALAVACPGHGDVAGTNSYATCSFGELERDATHLARGFVELGVKPGTRVVLLVRPGIEFVKLVFALLQSGATTVLIDPGMGRRHLVQSLREVEPAGFVAVSPAQAVRTVLRRKFPHASLNVTVGRRWFWGGVTYDQLLSTGRRSAVRLPEMLREDPAAIIFTSGSTGAPKGVLYTHQMFATQTLEIQRRYSLHAGGVDLACFPLFGLFNATMGVTTVFPSMDFSQPAKADPRKLLAAAHDWRVTQAFASPAVWDKLSRHCDRYGERIPTLRKVFSCGAPVPAEVLRRTIACVDPLAEMHTPYGATESLPVATIEASEVLHETAEQTSHGAGVCVGKRFDSIEWRIVRISDSALDPASLFEEVPVGEIGELIVRGPQVSPAYIGGNVEDDNAYAKVPDDPSCWHRMGDVGYLDTQGRFWYCGRKSHRVVTGRDTLYSIPCETIFNQHPDVARSALVGIGPVGSQTPLLVVEPISRLQSRFSRRKANARYHQLQADLLKMAAENEHTRQIKQLLFHPALPVDVRHNAKINRERLADWALRMHQNQRL